MAEIIKNRMVAETTGTVVGVLRVSRSHSDAAKSIGHAQII